MANESRNGAEGGQADGLEGVKFGAIKLVAASAMFLSDFCLVAVFGVACLSGLLNRTSQNINPNDLGWLAHNLALAAVLAVAAAVVVRRLFLMKGFSRLSGSAGMDRDERIKLGVQIYLRASIVAASLVEVATGFCFVLAFFWLKSGLGFDVIKARNNFIILIAVALIGKYIVLPTTNRIRVCLRRIAD